MVRVLNIYPLTFSFLRRYQHHKYKFMKIIIDWRIIEKSFIEDLSPDEQDQLDRWLEASERHRDFYNNAMSGGPTNPIAGLDKRILKEKKEDLFQQLFSENIEIKKQIVHWTAYAALVILFLGITLVFRTKEEKIINQDSQPVSATFPALPPGSQKAILTLSDGRRVILGDSSKHEIVTDKNGQIQNKNHMLVYAEQKSVVPAYNIISIPRGGEYHLMLSDGTKVWVNSNTEIRYPVAFSPTDRTVNLKGEAYFEVKKDSRPFKVIVEDLQIKVYGTSFNVNSYRPRHIETTLVEGQVGLTCIGDTAETHLEPSEQARYTKGETNIDVCTVNVNDYIAWKNGEFVFNDQTIEEIMDRLSMWYDIDVKYTDESVKQRKFTGVMHRYATIDKILYYIQETATIRFCVQDKQIIVR